MGKVKTVIIIIELVVIVLLLAYIVRLKSTPVASEEEKIINTLIINDIKEILKLAVSPSLSTWGTRRWTFLCGAR